MLDVLLLGELCWVWLWVRAKSGERALLYVGAVFTAVFVGTHVAPWFARHFMETGSTFEWLADRMHAATHPVGLATLVVPAVPTAAVGFNRSQWIALHVLQGLFTVLMTWAIFMVFIIVEYLMQAFWDEEQRTLSRFDSVLANVSGLICGVILAWTILWLLANLSWMSVGPRMAGWMTSSVLYSLLGHAAPVLNHLLSMLSWEG